MTPSFELVHVTRTFGRVAALDDVTVSVPHGSIVGLVGRNGSGKTTLMNHITGLLLPDSGEARTLGMATAELSHRELARMGVVRQHDPLLGWMRAGRFLEYVASFYDRWDTELEASLVGTLELDRAAKVGTMSPGKLQRLALVAATCHHPELLLLDEPLADLDPLARKTVLQLILDRFTRVGMTIVISSHLLHDIEPIVDRLLVLDRGRVVADDTLDDLKERHSRDLEGIFTLLVAGTPGSPGGP
jgi:ABC-2 type transport system ATP-binding protein